MTTETIDGRLAELREQYAIGQQQLVTLDQRRTEVRDTLLRITGAIKVLEELEELAGKMACSP